MIDAQTRTQLFRFLMVGVLATIAAAISDMGSNIENVSIEWGLKGDFFDSTLRVEGAVRRLADPSGIELEGDIVAAGDSPLDGGLGATEHVVDDRLRLLEHPVERLEPLDRIFGEDHHDRRAEIEAPYLFAASQFRGRFGRQQSFRAALDLARQRSRYETVEFVKADMLETGLDDAEIVDLIHAIAIFGWANRLIHPLGHID